MPLASWMMATNVALSATSRLCVKSTRTLRAPFFRSPSPTQSGAAFVRSGMLLLGTSRMSASGPPAASMNALYISGPCAPPPTAMTVPFIGPTLTAPVPKGSALYGALNGAGATGPAAGWAAMPAVEPTAKASMETAAKVALLCMAFSPEDRPVVVNEDRRAPTRAGRSSLRTSPLSGHRGIGPVCDSPFRPRSSAALRPCMQSGIAG